MNVTLLFSPVSRLSALLPLFLLLSMVYGLAAASPPLLESGQTECTIQAFDAKRPPAELEITDAKAKLVRSGDGRALQVRFNEALNPGFGLCPEGEGWNLDGAIGLAIDVENKEKRDISIVFKIESRTADGKRKALRLPLPLKAEAKQTIRLFFQDGGAGPYWGLRGIPVFGSISITPFRDADAVNPAQVTALKVNIQNLDESCEIVFDNLRAFTGESPLRFMVPHPFIDQYGQYIHADWPGKLTDPAQFEERIQAEKEELDKAPSFKGLDRFGGWAEGPQLEATGWFRTEEVDGKWWLVTPEGHVFLSMGMDCVYPSGSTFVQGREGWFEGLPGLDGPFKPFYGTYGSSHSMADAIDGEGKTFDFLEANLFRKYGDDWREEWRAMSYKRLHAWGFNTLGNWCNEDVMENSDMPFVVTLTSTRSGRSLKAGGGYWANLVDPYDEGFKALVEKGVAGRLERYKDNPRCIGYFVDNEMAWEVLPGAVFDCPPDQPARKALVDYLKGQYASLAELNKAWGTDAADWDSLRAPKRAPSEACREVLDGFTRAYATQYFTTVEQAVHKLAPNQLYLGCRLALGSRPVYEACAAIADVVSFNLYRKEIRSEDWTGENDLNAPIIIGEFHFGALDRGMFHEGLVATADQNARAEAYANYVRSVVDCPAFVGCHWFQYKDQATTGRCYDGENYNIGFVNIVDTPYPEMVEAAKTVHAEMYTRRLKASTP